MYKPVKQKAEKAVDGHRTIINVLTGIRRVQYLLKMINFSV